MEPMSAKSMKEADLYSQYSKSDLSKFTNVENFVQNMEQKCLENKDRRANSSVSSAEKPHDKMLKSQLE